MPIPENYKFVGYTESKIKQAVVEKQLQAEDIFYHIENEQMNDLKVMGVSVGDVTFFTFYVQPHNLPRAKLILETLG